MDAHPILLLDVGTNETEIRPGAQASSLPAGREPASPRAPYPPVRAGWCWISDAIRRFEASRAADVIGTGIVACLVYAIFLFAGVLG